MPQRSKKEHIIEVATQLFYLDGFNATGIEKIRNTASVSKKTLYNHFDSKNDLILTVLQREDQGIQSGLEKFLDGISQDPRERLLALFDYYAYSINSEEFKGCIFIKAASEFSDSQDPCKIASVGAKRLMRKTINGLTTKLKATNPKTLASQLDLLLQGAIVQAQVADDFSAIKLAKEMAINLIDQATDITE